MDLKKNFSTFFLQKVRNKLVLLDQDGQKALRLFWIFEFILILLLYKGINSFSKGIRISPLDLIHVSLTIFIILTTINAKLSFLRYKKKYKDNILEILFKELLEDYAFFHRLYLSEDEYKKSLLFQGEYNQFSGEDLVEGKIQGVSFRMSELSVIYNSRNRSKRNKTVIFKGIMIVSPGSQKFKNETVVEPDILEKNFGGFMGRFLRKVEFSKLPVVYVESPEFEREFKVMGSDQVEARRVITPRMQEHLMELVHKSKMRFGMSLANNQISIALPTKKNFFDPPYFSSCVETKTLKEIIIIFDLLVSIHDELEKL